MSKDMLSRLLANLIKIINFIVSRAMKKLDFIEFLHSVKHKRIILANPVSTKH